MNNRVANWLWIGLALAFVLVVGCSYDGAELGEVECDELTGCEPGAECIEGYCVHTGGSPITDTGGDADLDAEFEEDTDVEGEPDTEIECDPGESPCDGVCVDLLTDPRHCSSCGNECNVSGLGTAQCVDGDCEVDCGDYDECEGECIDTSNDPGHCGECGDSCPLQHVCEDGECADACSEGTTNCDGSCVNTDSNPVYCGGCDGQCSFPSDADPICEAGHCGFECKSESDKPCGDQCIDSSSPLVDCSGDCADLQADDDHCGSCDNECSSDESCSDGLCCEGETINCGGACTDTDSSVDHCGGCGDECDDYPDHSEPECDDGTCSFECIQGYDECSGACIDYDSNLDHCGGCGDECEPPSGATAICDGGTCDFECNADLKKCDGECIDAEDVCGDCDPSHDGDFGGGLGTELEPFTICTVDHLNEIGEGGTDYLEDYFLLTEDVDLGGDSLSIIGSEDDHFQGRFDGGGNEISELVIDLPDEDYVGLFRALGADAEIIDLNLSDIDISGNITVGGLAGLNHGLIEGVEVGGDLVEGSSFVGGLVGSNFGVIKNAHSRVDDITVDENDVGGLVGLNGGRIEDSGAVSEVDGGGEVAGGLAGQNNGEIVRSWATGDVSGELFVGGLVGFMAPDGEITESTASGTVDGNREVGGLVGQSNGDIIDCYATGAVDADESSGGLVGHLYLPNNGDEGAVIHSYSMGSVAGDAGDIGGLIGEIDTHQHATAEIDDAYWDIETSGQTDSADGQGLETDQFSDAASDFDDHFGDWDFDTVWELSDAVDGENERPVLQWQNL